MEGYKKIYSGISIFDTEEEVQKDYRQDEYIVIDGDLYSKY